MRFKIDECKALSQTDIEVRIIMHNETMRMRALEFVSETLPNGAGINWGDVVIMADKVMGYIEGETK